MNRKEACDKVADIITKDRARTHGEAVTQLANVQQIKRAVGHHANQRLNDTILEAIDSICIKLSRIANGLPVEDHFLDIMGYAAIAIESLHLDRPEEIPF